MVRFQSTWLSCMAAAMFIAGGCGSSSSQQCYCSRTTTPATAPVTVAVPAAAAPAPAPPIVVEETPLRTEQFESGSLQMADVPSHQLEVFLRDLNRRRDYDYSQHAEQAGPNHEYLTRWLQTTSAELIHRGYSYDSSGELHSPDNTVVPTR